MIFMRGNIDGKNITRAIKPTDIVEYELIENNDAIDVHIHMNNGRVHSFSTTQSADEVLNYLSSETFTIK